MLTPPKQTESTILDPAISLQKQNKTAEAEESLIFDANIARGGISPCKRPLLRVPKNKVREGQRFVQDASRGTPSPRGDRREH